MQELYNFLIKYKEGNSIRTKKRIYQAATIKLR
jgi:hypothetical protein